MQILGVESAACDAPSGVPERAAERIDGAQALKKAFSTTQAASRSHASHYGARRRCRQITLSKQLKRA
jgi:hypothetical protein